MASYLLLYHGALPKSKSKRQKQKAQAEWTRWDSEITNSVVDSAPTSDAVKVTPEDTKPAVDDPVTGFRRIKAENLEQAVEISRGAPQLHDNGWAEIYEVLDDSA